MNQQTDPLVELRNHLMDKLMEANNNCPKPGLIPTAYIYMGYKFFVNAMDVRGEVPNDVFEFIHSSHRFGVYSRTFNGFPVYVVPDISGNEHPDFRVFIEFINNPKVGY